MKTHSIALAILLFLGHAARLPAQEDTSALRRTPELLNPGDHGVGGFVEDLEFQDLQGGSHRLSDFGQRKAVVIAMTSTSCPLSGKYWPTLLELARQYSPRGVQFVLVNPVAADRVEQMQAAQRELADAGLYVFDQQEALARAVGATTTTDVVVLDSSRTIVYHGAVDDQYGIGYATDAAKRHYLTDALNAVLDDRQPLIAATAAPGCTLDLETVQSVGNSPTYHGRIARLMQRHCIECHREGGVAPFALTSYEDVVAHAPMIREVVQQGIMPPWFAAHPQPDKASRWVNDRSLSASEQRDLLAWIAADRPAGDPANAPQPRTFPDGWLIGEPDAVFEFAEPVPVKATGTMPYQNVTVETNLPEDKWVQAIEVRPGNPSVVHHVLVFVQVPASGEGETPEVDERMGYWGIYVPGNSTLVYPDGLAKRLPQGAKLLFQMHYTPNGQATEDRTRIGVVFAKEPPQHEVHVAGVINTRLKIPAGAANHEEIATLRVPHDVQVLALLPHMHLRGKAARYEIVSEESTTTLLDIPRYDFNWQLLYRLAEPLPLKQGDTIRFTAWYDNSTGNPANPDSTKTVRWGPQTSDEMQLGYVEYIVPGEQLGEGRESMARARGRGAARDFAGAVLFRRLDVNGDGRLTKDEVRQRMPDRVEQALAIFDRLDTDASGELDKTEFAKLREQQQ